MQKIRNIGKTLTLSPLFGSHRDKPRFARKSPESFRFFQKRKSPRLGARSFGRSFFSRPPLIPAHNRPLLVTLDLLLVTGVLGAFVCFAYVKTAPDDMLRATLSVDGNAYQLQTRPTTVGTLLQNFGITLNPGDEVTPAPEELLREGEQVFIQRAFPVAVLSKGEATVLHMSGGTVGEALSKADVRYDVDDELSHLAFADVTPGIQIQHTDVTTQYASSYKTLYYEEETVRDPSRYTEFNDVETQGKNGLKQVTQRVISKNGLVVSREIVDQLVISPAINQVTRVGTKVHYQTSYTGETRLYKPAPKAGEGGWVEMTVYRCTAYTGGGRTATGTRPKLGSISVNPKKIPYGSQIYVKGYGYGTAQDTGAFRNYAAPKDNAIDLYFNSEKECARWGSKYNLKILVKLR